MRDQDVLLDGFLTEGAPERHMNVKIDTSDVPMEMVWHSTLSRINEPVSRPVELVTKVVRDHNHIRELQSRQLLNVAIRSSVHDHWPSPIVT